MTNETDLNAADQSTAPAAAPEPQAAPETFGEGRHRVLEPIDEDHMTPWRAYDYGETIYRSGAHKLADSGVAPLVAVARGYTTVIADGAKKFAAERGIGDGRSKRGSQFLNSFRDDGDVLILPWFTTLQMRKNSTEFENRLIPTSYQMRPESPRINEKGKTVKYEFLVGSETVLDFHPAVTAEWLAGVEKTMLAEGLLKGDAALTAQIRQYATDEELAAPISHDPILAQTRLAALMDRIPRSERVAIISMAGVGNWRNNQEWSSINVKDHEVYIAFDGDVLENYNVWTMARDLFKLVENKHGRPWVLILDDPSIKIKGFGVDDFLAKMGTFEQLLTMVQDQMPARPPLPLEKRVGEWRVSEEGTSVELCVQDDNGDAHWETQCNIGGRIKSMQVRRPASVEEMRTGKFGENVKWSAFPATCVIELSWYDEVTQTTKTAEISAPNSVLAYPPSEWERKGAFIPNSVLLHPDFPPKKGAEWLSAIKKNEAGSIDDRTIWSTMGWVPTDTMSDANGRSMAYIVGETVIAENDDVAGKIQIGVDESDLADSSKFGVVDDYAVLFATDEPRTEEEKAERKKAKAKAVRGLRADIKALADAYLFDGPWMSEQIGPSLISAALRPAVPLPTNTCVYLSGPPQSGKTWSARVMMSFWQRTPGTWWEPNPLPGAAADTMAATEQAVAKSVIWTVDDLAPTPDKRKADNDESKIGDLIRSVFNKAGKRRSNADLSARQVPTPLALLILTAENQNSIGSARERVLGVEFRGLKAEKMEQAERLMKSELTAARITAAIVRMYIQRGLIKEGDDETTNAWEDVISSLAFTRDNSRVNAEAILEENGVRSKDTSRPALIVSDTAMGLLALRDLCQLVGGLDEVASHIHWEQGGWLRLIAEQVALSNRSKAENAPGKVLISCLADMLLGGRGHVINLDDPSQPPIVDNADAVRMNTFLGWQASGNDGVMQPKGTRLGYYSVVNGEPTVFFIRDDAFGEAQRIYSKRILHGASPHTSWTDVWNSGLVPQPYLDLAAKPLKGSTEPRGIPTHLTVQFRTGPGKQIRPYGVPIALDRLFSIAEGQDDTADADGDDFDVEND